MNEKEEQFIRITSLLNAAVPVIKEVLEGFNEDKDVPLEIVVYHNILQRFYYCIKSIECLLHKFNSDTNYKFPIGLLVRNGLLDFIISGYLFEKGYRKGSFSSEFAKINHKFVSDKNKILQTLRGNKTITPEEFQKELRELKSYFPDNFLSIDKNGTPQLKKDVNSIAPSKMAKNLKDHSDVYFLYDYYSQYEHYGTFSKIILDGHAEYDFDKLKVAFCYIFLGIILCLDILKASKDKKANIEKIWDEIRAMPELCRQP